MVQKVKIVVHRYDVRSDPSPNREVVGFKTLVKRNRDLPGAHISVSPPKHCVSSIVHSFEVKKVVKGLKRGRIDSKGFSAATIKPENEKAR